MTDYQLNQTIVKALESYRKEMDDMANQYRREIEKSKSLRNLVTNIDRNTNNKITDAESKITSLSKALGLNFQNFKAKFRI